MALEFNKALELLALKLNKYYMPSVMLQTGLGYQDVDLLHADYKIKVIVNSCAASQSSSESQNLHHVHPKAPLWPFPHLKKTQKQKQLTRRPRRCIWTPEHDRVIYIHVASTCNVAAILWTLQRQCPYHDGLCPATNQHWTSLQ